MIAQLTLAIVQLAVKSEAFEKFATSGEWKIILGEKGLSERVINML